MKFTLFDMLGKWEEEFLETREWLEELLAGEGMSCQEVTGDQICQDEPIVQVSGWVVSGPTVNLLLVFDRIFMAKHPCFGESLFRLVGVSEDITLAAIAHKSLYLNIVFLEKA